MRRRCVLVAFLLAVSVQASRLQAERVPLIPAPTADQTARSLARQLPREHLTHAPLDDSVSGRAWTNYLSSLDPDRLYFLSSDIEAWRPYVCRLDDDLQTGDIRFAYEVFLTFLERLQNRHAYVKALLDAGFDVESEESYRWKRQELPWPGDEAEWDEIWRKKIKNEYVRILVDREMASQEQASTPLGEKPQGDDEEKEEDQDEEEKDDPTVPPEEAIGKRYEQLTIVLNDTDAEWVLQRYLSAFALAYDPHSIYMSPSTLEDFNIEMQLSLVGIGALLRSKDGAAEIVRTIPGGPADLDKRDIRLMPNDKIVAVGQDEEDPVNILHWPLQKVVAKIRGPKGSRVVLTVVPASDPTGITTKTVDLFRDEVKLEDMAASARVEEAEGSDGVKRKLGIIKLPTFYANLKVRSVDDADFRSSAYDVELRLKELVEKGVDGILLDLRNNGGGSLLEAIRMTGLFIATGPVVQVQEKIIRVLRDRDPAVAYAGPLVVLVNRLSASASEILAGALQDYERAVIAGDSKTHGKGTVQTIIDVGGDAALGSLKVTSASYYRISGGSTQLRGIIPDIVIPSPFDFMGLGEDHLSNPIPWTRVRAVEYEPAGSVAAAISDLEAKSDRRRAANPRYGAYTQMLARIEAMTQSEEVPLHFGQRKALAEQEKELSDVQRRLTDEGSPEDKDAPPDLVLEEGLSILADLVATDLAAPAPPPPPPAAPVQKSFLQVLEEWLRQYL